MTTWSLFFVKSCILCHSDSLASTNNHLRMTYPKKLLLILFCVLSFSFFLNAQQATMTSGGEASGSGGTVSYSVGQVAYHTNSGTNYSESQGIQQPYEISVVTNTIEINGQLIEVLVFPNPSVDQLTLTLEGILINEVTYELYDLQGRRIANQPVNSDKTDIDVSYLPPATYFLKVLQGQQTITHFKILKN